MRNYIIFVVPLIPRELGKSFAGGFEEKISVSSQQGNMRNLPIIGHKSTKLFKFNLNFL